ncbi:MAG: hypothetical protein NUK65_02585 [Firmicutes bacterium]|nr:hypothetical protein [Bacillota bacterium]
MDYKKMERDFCKAALPGILIAIGAGVKVLVDNHDTYFDEENKE